MKEERLRQRRPGQKRGWPLSFLNLVDGKGYAFEGKDSGQNEDGSVVGEGEKVNVELADTRKLGIVTLGAMKQYSRIELFLGFLRSWYLCYFTPDAARQLQTAAPAQHLNRIGSNLNNVAQYMYRENPAEFKKILEDIQTKIPNITKIEPVKLQNGQMVYKSLQGITAAIIIVLDNDDRDTEAFRSQLENAAMQNMITMDRVFCIAVEEMEAWLPGDESAVIAAYPRARIAWHNENVFLG